MSNYLGEMAADSINKNNSTKILGMDVAYKWYIKIFVILIKFR
jgi:hypothetical protein